MKRHRRECHEEEEGDSQNQPLRRGQEAQGLGLRQDIDHPPKRRARRMEKEEDSSAT